MILPDDFVGDPALFSEQLVRLPPAAMPYRLRRRLRLRGGAAAARARDLAARVAGGPVRIAVPASVMKLDPPFFDALARGGGRGAPADGVPHLPARAASGWASPSCGAGSRERLPMAVVHEELPYEAYVERLAACDFFVCPFPYGNMNSIVDAVMVGLPGVCLDGPEAHAHADVGLLPPHGLPGGADRGHAE